MTALLLATIVTAQRNIGHREVPTMMTDAELSKQAYRLLSELARRNRVRMATAAGAVPVRQVSISRENGKPTLVVS